MTLKVFQIQTNSDYIKEELRKIRTTNPSKTITSNHHGKIKKKEKIRTIPEDQKQKKKKDQ